MKWMRIRNPDKNLQFMCLPVIERRQQCGLQLTPELEGEEGQDEEGPRIGEVVQKSEQIEL